MLGDQSLPSSSRQDRRLQNTYEDRPVELQQRLPHTVQAFKSPLHDEHPRQDQLHAQSRANIYTTYAPTVASAATVATYSVVTVTSSTAPAVPQPPFLRTARRAYPADSSRFGPLPIQTSVASCTSVPGFGPLPIQDLRCHAQLNMSNLAQPSALHQQYDDSNHPPEGSHHHEQPVHYSAAGGRGSFGAPPVGPIADHAGDKDYEATSAFYRNATFHRAALDSFQPPLILAELPLEPFDGDIRRYPMFRNNFLEIVEGHPDLAPRHKLQYLLQFLRGEPYQLVNNFQLTDVNYFAAVNMLEERYGNEDRRRNLLLAEFVNLRPPSDELADLYRFHSEVVRLTGELKQLGDDVDANPIYGPTLMGCLSEKLRFKLIQNYGCDREKSVSAILNGLWRYASNREMAMTSGISWRPRAPSPPEATCRERLRSPPPRSPSESSTEESTECSEDTSAGQPTACVAKAVITRPTEERWRCQLCGLPHAANNCTTYATVTQRVRRIQKLSLCLHCLSEGHRVDSCPQKGLDLCQVCHNGSHHRAVCRTAAVGSESRPLRRSSRCATRGSSIVRKRSVPKRHVRKARGARPVTSSASAARKLRRSGTQHRPTQIVDNPNKRHAPVKKAVHRSDSRRAKSTAPNTVPSSALRQNRENKPRASPDRENKPRASPTTQGPSGDGNSKKIYRKKKSGNTGTSSQGRESTTRPSTTSTDESVKQKGIDACDVGRLLAGLEAILATARRSTNDDLPKFDRAQDRAGSGESSVQDPDANRRHEHWDEDKSSTTSTGSSSDAPTEPSDAAPGDHKRFPTYKNVRAYVASASTNDAHAPLHECLKVTATNPVNGVVRKVIVFFDSGSDFSYIAPTLARDLDLPLHGKCVVRVNTFGNPVPLTVKGFSTSVVLCSPQGRHVSLSATTGDLAIPSVRTALVEDTDLPMLRGSKRELSPTQVTPDILIGQDCIHLFGRQHGLRLPTGYDVVHTILGPTVGGAPQVAYIQPKAVPSSSATPAVEVTGPRIGRLQQQPFGTTDASPSQTVISSTQTPSYHQPFKADDHPCQQNELIENTTSTTLRAEKQPLLEHTERSELLQRKQNPLDTARPPQPGLHSTYAVLQPKLHLDHPFSAEHLCPPAAAVAMAADRNERRRSSVAEASPVSYVKAPQSAKQRSQPARRRRSPCPIRQKDGRGRASEKHRQQKKSFQPGPLPTVELEQSISMSTDDKDKKRTSSQFGPLPTADAAKQLTHGEKKEHSSRDDHRSKDNQDQHHSSRAPTRSRSSTQSAEARDHRERSPGRLQHEKPRSSSSSNSPPKCSEVFVREKSGSASTGEPLQAFEPTPALLHLGQLRLKIDPHAHPVEAAHDVLSPRADRALVPPASPDVPRESIYSTALVSGHSTMADDTNHHAPPEPSDDSTTVDSTRNNDHRRQQDVRVGTHYLRRATSTADADSSRPSASRFGPLPIADSTEAEVQAPHPPAHLIRRSASRFGPLPIVDSAEAENTNAPQDPVTLSMFACLDAVPVPVTRGAPDILMDQHPPSALDKEGASTMGDLQLNRNIDDDGPDRNTYSQSARNRSTSKERQSWSGAPQFGPLPTADAAATVTASSSRLPNRRHGPGTDAGEATTATVSTGYSTEQLNKPRGLKTITEAANKVAARRHRLQHVIKPLKPTDLETATAKKIQAPMQKERAGAAANTPQQPVDQSDPSASRFGPLPVVDSTRGAAKMPQQPANQSKPNASRFGPLPIVDSTGAEPIYTPQHPTTQTKSARSDSGHLPDKDHTVGHASKDLPDAVHSSSSLSTETERRVLVDELARTIKALYGGTILHAVSAELMRHFPDAAGPGNNPILDSILEYVARKTTAQLADSYPTLLRDMPRLLTIAEICHSATEADAPQPTAHAVLVPVARADPMDQEDNASSIKTTSAVNVDRTHEPASPPSSAPCCAPPVHAAEQPSVARRHPAEAAREQAFSQSDAIRVLRTTRDDSPLKNETVCFCDGSTFLYFGCLLRPEVLMILTPMSSLEGALRSVCDFHPSKEVGRVIFWLSDSHSTPLSPAVQLRLAVELSRHYATKYPTVTQYVVATPSIGSRQDVWTCGLFKLLVQMQVLLPHARLIMSPRRNRSVTQVDVYDLKRYLRDHHHLNLWSRYDADIPQAVQTSYSSPTPQQRRVARATTSDNRSATEAPDAARSQDQRRPLYNKADDPPMDAATDATKPSGPAHPPGKKQSRQHNGLRDGSAKQPIVQFPPPPSQSRFRSSPLSAQFDPAQARKMKPRSCSRPALLAVKEPPTTNARGKKKEHTFRKEIHHRSVETQTRAAPAKNSKQPTKRKPSKSRLGPLPVVDKTVSETAERQGTLRLPRVCAFCDHPHGVAKCARYSTKAQRVRRARELGYCFTCLRVGHLAKECPQRTTLPCYLCKQGHHHRALCPPASPAKGSEKQLPARRSQPVSSTLSATKTTQKPVSKVAKKTRKPSRAAGPIDAPPAAQMLPTTETAKAQHRRKARKRKDREPKT